MNATAGHDAYANSLCRQRVAALLRVPILAVALGACSGPGADPSAAPESTAYSRPRPVTLVGYDDDAMEPFLTRDGRVLLFNNSNDPAAQTDLHWAERVDDTTFAWRGRLQGVNTDSLEGVPSTDNQGQLYFVSPREYASTRATVYRGRLHDGRVESLQRLDSLASSGLAMVVFDAEVSADGQWLALSEGRFVGAGAPITADLLIARRQGAEFQRLPASSHWLAAINTGALEYAACWSNDRRTLLFTRAGDSSNGGAPSIWITHRGSDDQPFQPPLRLSRLDGFVEAPALSPDERLLYYHRRDGQRWRIYVAER
ncbi:MAG: PD40 domain-containing protein [Burkholderiaceae bacterium]|nr:PD40 domain-containing protein [Burkholderiaceae bacterium]